MPNNIDHKDSQFNLRQDVLVCLFLIVATLAVYWQVQNFDFVNFDDGKYVAENQHVQEGLTVESIVWAFKTIHAGNWHPLTWLSHMLDCRLFGLNPGRHHLTNLFFHIANTLLLFVVFRRMTGSLWQSAFVAALFALHPSHVESVAWISERKDVLSTFFWMLTMWGYIRYVDHLSVHRYLLVILFFVLGLMSKPMLVTLPFVLLLLDFWPLKRIQIEPSDPDIGNVRQKSNFLFPVLEKVPLIALAAASSMVTFYAQKHGGAVASLDVIPLKARIANALVVYVKYIGNMIYPAKLAALYPHPVILPLWQTSGACLLLVSISFAAIISVRQRPYVAAGWLWYLGTLVPVIGLVQVGNQAMADRYTYVPLIGLFVIIAWGVPELVISWKHRIKWLSLLATIMLAALMVVTWKQVGYWKNSITLFEHTLEVTSNNYVPHNNLGLALDQQGRTKEAIEHYLQALRIQPAYAAAHNNLGNALNKLGRTEDAVNHYLQALRITPDFKEAHNNLGVVLDKQGRTEEAVAHYLQALRINPDYADAHSNLGNALKKLGRTEEAIDHYLQVLRIQPDFEEVHNNLGNALLKQGKDTEAIEHFNEALRINPKFVAAYNSLAIAFIRVGKTDEAIALLQKAIQINPNDPDTLVNWGGALIGMGKSDDAVVPLRKALQINPDISKAHMNLGIALASTGKIEDAIAHFRKALQIDPNNAEAQHNLNNILATLKKVDREISTLQTELGFAPKDPMLNYNLGNLYKTKGQLDTAQDYYQKAIALQPKFPEALYELAKLYISRDEYQKALFQYEKILTFMPDTPAVYYNVACIYARQNKSVESVACLKKAVAKGFNDWNHIKTDKDLDNIRSSAEYNAFIEGR